MNDSHSSSNPMPSFTLPICCFNYHMNLLLLPNAFSWDGNVNLLEQTCVNTALIKCSCMPFQGPLTVPLQNWCAWGLIAASGWVWPPSCHLSPFINFIWDEPYGSAEPPRWLSSQCSFYLKGPLAILGHQSATCLSRPRSLSGPTVQPCLLLSHRRALIFQSLAPPTLCMFC